jgi:formimidoylglutamate deiminase
MAVAAGAIAPGMRADLVVLDPRDAALAEQDVDTMLDAAIFGPCRNAVRDVMVGGRWVVREGHHVDEDEVYSRYRRTVAALRR